MDRRFIPAEYELPEEKEPRSNRQWLAAIAALVVILAATIALVTAAETNSPVAVEIGR